MNIMNIMNVLSCLVLFLVAVTVVTSITPLKVTEGINVSLLTLSHSWALSSHEFSRFCYFRVLWSEVCQVSDTLKQLL